MDASATPVISRPQPDSRACCDYRLQPIAKVSFRRASASDLCGDHPFTRRTTFACTPRWDGFLGAFSSFARGSGDADRGIKNGRIKSAQSFGLTSSKRNVICSHHRGRCSSYSRSNQVRRRQAWSYRSRRSSTKVCLYTSPIYSPFSRPESWSMLYSY